MEIILKQDIANLGSKDDLLKVKDGYARNYLIPQGIAIIATTGSKKMREENLKQRAHKEEKLRLEATTLAEQLKELTLTIGAKASSKGKIFGSVNNIQISQALAAKGFDIDRKKIIVKSDAIKELGSYTSKIKLYRDIFVEISFEIVAE